MSYLRKMYKATLFRDDRDEKKVAVSTYVFKIEIETNSTTNKITTEEGYVNAETYSDALETIQEQYKLYGKKAVSVILNLDK